MDKYRRVDKPKQSEDTINENEIRITTQGKMRNYITYASNLFQEKKSPEVVLKAMGRAINKTVTIAEILKRRVVGLHQITSIDSTDITDIWEPIEEGLDRVETTRHVSSITIVLSLNQLDKNAPGYQQPISEDLIKPFTAPAVKATVPVRGTVTRGRARASKPRGSRGGRGRGRGGMGQSYDQFQQDQIQPQQEQQQQQQFQQGPPQFNPDNSGRGRGRGRGRGNFQGGNQQGGDQREVSSFTRGRGRGRGNFQGGNQGNFQGGNQQGNYQGDQQSNFQQGGNQDFAYGTDQQGGRGRGRGGRGRGRGGRGTRGRGRGGRGNFQDDGYHQVTGI